MGVPVTMFARQFFTTVCKAEASFAPAFIARRSFAVDSSDSDADRSSFGERPKFSGERPAPDKKKRVFVGNLPYEAQWGELRDFMKTSAGEVRFATIFKDRNTGNSKGCGIVEFETEESAKVAVEELNDTVFPGSERTIF